MATSDKLIYRWLRAVSRTQGLEKRQQSHTTSGFPNNSNYVGGASFSLILGMVGLGMSLRTAVKLWSIPSAIAELQLALSFGLWLWLIRKYLAKLLRNYKSTLEEFDDPVFGSTGALIGISTLVLVPGLAVYSRATAVGMTVLGIAFHLYFSIRHTFTLWVADRDSDDVTPALYLPDVAGNFTSASALAVLGLHDWAWLFFGAGLLSWLSLEPIVKRNIFYGAGLPTSRRHTAGIQAAPAVVCASSLLNINPSIEPIFPSILLGYALYQMLHALRLLPWLREQPLSKAHWAYTFGLTSALNCTLKLALLGNAAAHTISLPLIFLVSSFVLYLFAKTIIPKPNGMN
ncbi:dicarboxylate transporter/tellurite-resistance protein TehA [Massilia sp. 2TAF26]|uniref:SLAC1 family transporter n=1 Tax=Massilia sp. 2TAF26 TaxID=3233012 RepID=UPI003F9B026F